jgi:hypothetical protein
MVVQLASAEVASMTVAKTLSTLDVFDTGKLFHLNVASEAKAIGMLASRVAGAAEHRGGCRGNGRGSKEGADAAGCGSSEEHCD